MSDPATHDDLQHLEDRLSNRHDATDRRLSAVEEHMHELSSWGQVSEAERKAMKSELDEIKQIATDNGKAITRATAWWIGIASGTMALVTLLGVLKLLNVI